MDLIKFSLLENQTDFFALREEIIKSKNGKVEAIKIVAQNLKEEEQKIRKDLVRKLLYSIPLTGNFKKDQWDRTKKFVYDENVRILKNLKLYYAEYLKEDNLSFERTISFELECGRGGKGSSDWTFYCYLKDMVFDDNELHVALHQTDSSGRLFMYFAKNENYTEFKSIIYALKKELWKF